MEMSDCDKAFLLLCVRYCEAGDNARRVVAGMDDEGLLSCARFLSAR